MIKHSHHRRLRHAHPVERLMLALHLDETGKGWPLWPNDPYTAVWEPRPLVRSLHAAALELLP